MKSRPAVRETVLAVKEESWKTTKTVLAALKKLKKSEEVFKRMI